MSDAQIKKLQQMLTEQNDALKSGLNKRIWLIAGAVIFVFAYMTFITMSLARTITPETVADMVLGYTAENGPILRTKMVKIAEENIPAVIDTGVQQLYKQLPELRTSLQNQVEAIYPQLPEDFYQDLAAQLDVYFQQKSDVIASILTEIDTETERQTLFEDISSRVDANMRFLLAATASETDSLAGRIEELIQTDDNDLGREKLKIKEILIYFLYLTKQMNT